MAFFSRPHSASAAVKIVNPNTQDDLKPPRKDSVQRQCRNIMIYGSCKFQDKGCVYYHPPAQDAPQFVPRSNSPATVSLSAQAVNAPVFIPKASGTSIPNASSPPPMTVSRQSSLTSPSPPSPAIQSEYQDYNVHDHYEYAYPQEMILDSLSTQLQDTNFYDEGQHRLYPSEYDQNTMDSFYSTASQPTFVRQPLNYHLYTAPIPPNFVPSSMDSYFLPPSSVLRELLRTRSETIRTVSPPGLSLPEELQGYHTLVPLEPVSGEKRKFGSWYSTVYRAISATDGGPYALRRVENYRLMHQAAFSTIEAWSRIRHPSIISVHEAFTTRSFNDNSLVVAYAYHPNAQTLFDAHLKPKANTSQHQQHQWFSPARPHPQSHPQSSTIPERTIWSYVIQIASAIKKVHDAGQAVRMIEATKILVTGKNRIRISSCGIVDVLMYDARQDPTLLQQEDFTMFGRLLLALCCNNTAAANGANLQKSLEIIGRTYGSDLKNVALFLMSKAAPHRKVEQLFEIIGTRVVTEMDDAQDAVDRLEGELMSELENARLVRLLCKFGFINERPEFAREPKWSETGDRYIIKLFRDYVFHQIDENNNPVVNLSHVLTCLNKLDAGTDERIMLVARDEQNCLVVTYKEIKSCIDSAFSELARGSSGGGGSNGYK